jgi:Rod binding domain-containing protein
MRTIHSPTVAGNTDAVAPSQSRLVRAAHEFEAQMMKELLKPMTRESSGASEDEDVGSGGALGEFASETLGRSLSEHGGFGIADHIVRELSQDGNQS